MNKTCIYLVILGILLLNQNLFSQEFVIGIMKDEPGSAAKYKPLIVYLKTKGIKASFKPARTYPEAAEMFINKKIDGMFSGSGIAACFMIKDIVIPLVRPVSIHGWSTYSAVILAKKGNPEFNQQAAFFKRKRLMFCRLASSGEFYFRSIMGSSKIEVSIQSVASHHSAIEGLEIGLADISIVKNRVWDEHRSKFPNIIEIGKDTTENPNNTLIISRNKYTKLTSEVKSILLGLENDNSTEAKAVKNSLQIISFIPTTIADFTSTIKLLKKAGVDKEFNFNFQK